MKKLCIPPLSRLLIAVTLIWTVSFSNLGGVVEVGATAPSTSNFSVAARVGAGVYDDTNSNWVYSGAWTAYTASGLANNTGHYTSTVGNYAELAFTGTSFILTYAKHPSYGSIDVYVDGTKINTIDTYASSLAWRATWISPSFAAGNHTVRFVHAGAAGKYIDLDAIEILNTASVTPIAPAPVGAGTYDDTNSNWVYSGTWTAYRGNGPLDNTSHYTSVIGSSAELTFTGRSFVLTYVKYPSYGSIDVYVDGTKINTIDTYASSLAWRATWISPSFAAGNHTVRLVHAGGRTYIDIDAIQILDTAPPAPTTPSTPTPVGAGTYDDANSSWVYSGGWTAYTGTGPLNNTSHYASTVGSSTELRFTGTSFVLTYAKYPSYGLIDVFVDGTKINTIDTYGSSLVWRATWTSPSFADGNHTVRFVHAGGRTYIDIDAIQIYSGTQAPPPTPGIGGSAYYVSASGNNADGKSWSTAWKSLGQVNWSVIQPGATIFVSGGTNGTTYSGGTRISKSGTANAYITITTGASSPSPAGHSGPVTIEGGDYCIRATGSYLLIKNLLCQHATSSGFRIEGTGTTLENNTVRETYGQGIHVHSCKSCVVRGNKVTTFPNDGASENRPYQTDGIVIYDSSDTFVEHNWIKLTNQYGSGHIDGIQAYSTSTTYRNITIRYNYVENTKAQLSNAQGIYLEHLYGDVKVIGNIVIVLQGNQAVASGYGSGFRSYIVGNIIKCGGYRCLWVANNPDPVIKNNILWQIGNNTTIKLENWAGSPANIDNNLNYAPNSSAPFGFGSGGLSWSSWRAKGFDSHGIYGQNPNLDSCLRPTSTSPAVGKGAVLSGSEYNQGLSLSLCGPNGPSAFLPIAFSSRGSSWDIGAYDR